MSRKVLVLFVASLCLCALPAFAENVKVVNGSQWGIYHFFLSPADTEEWGPDQLRDQVIAPGASFTLQGIPCDTYDVRLVDEDGDECIVGGVDVCGGNQQWNISSEELAACEGYGPDGGGDDEGDGDGK